MEAKAPRKGSVFDRLGGRVIPKVCTFWLAGRCNRNPCRFMHSEMLESDASPSHSCGANYQKQSRNLVWRSSNYSAPMETDEGRVGRSTNTFPDRELRNEERMQHKHMDLEIANAWTGKDENELRNGGRMHMD